jgi:AcrR family transcriptional regulator
MSDRSARAGTRRYRKLRRAELEDQTRLRITEAAVELHGTIGPARTTISAVAERAGVQRATVYRHFPDEEALFAACSSHWAALNPRPDPAVWAEIGDPDERLRTALAELYGWYTRTERMLVNVTRDSSLVPAMAAPSEAFGQYLGSASEVLLHGRRPRGARRRRVAAAIGHALAFSTWRSLVREQGVSGADAVDLMTSLVREAAQAPIGSITSRVPSGAA